MHIHEFKWDRGVLVRIRSNYDGIWIEKSDPDNVFMVTAMKRPRLDVVWKNIW
jgi:hypothetical protein